MHVSPRGKLSQLQGPLQELGLGMLPCQEADLLPFQKTLKTLRINTSISLHIFLCLTTLEIGVYNGSILPISLTSLKIFSCSTQDLSPLGALSHLENFELSDCHDSNELKWISNLSKLRFLALHGIERMQDHHFNSLATLSLLKTLHLGNLASVHGTGFYYLQSLSIESLEINKCPQFEVGYLSYLQRSLENLEFSHFVKGQLTSFPILGRLEKLNFRHCHILVKILQDLAYLKTILSLSFYCCDSLVVNDLVHLQPLALANMQSLTFEWAKEEDEDGFVLELFGGNVELSSLKNGTVLGDNDWES